MLFRSTDLNHRTSRGNSLNLTPSEVRGTNKPANGKTQSGSTKGTGNALKLVDSKNPNDFLKAALEKQGLDSAPANFKQKWSQDGYDFEVRIHPADPRYGKEGSIYRVARRQQGTDANGQGHGWEYIDSNGKWHHTSTLKPNSPTYNDQAAADTHIQLP